MVVVCCGGDRRGGAQGMRGGVGWVEERRKEAAWGAQGSWEVQEATVTVETDSPVLAPTCARRHPRPFLPTCSRCVCSMTARLTWGWQWPTLTVTMPANACGRAGSNRATRNRHAGSADKATGPVHTQAPHAGRCGNTATGTFAARLRQQAQSPTTPSFGGNAGAGHALRRSRPGSVAPSRQTGTASCRPQS